jgi:hypothetical protein
MRKLARAIAARSDPRFITVPPQRGGSKVHFTEEQLTVMRGGLTVEEYRQKTMAPCPRSASCLTNIASLCPKLSNP